MELRVLGRVAVVTGESEHVLGSTREASLLADLIAHAGHVVPADRLVEDLWPDRPPATAGATLYTYVRNLRRLLEPDRSAGAPSTVLLSRRPGYILVVDDEAVDARRFERLVRAAAEVTDDPDRRAATLREALSLWHGPAFGELAAQAHLQAEATRLEELRMTALEDRVEADLALGGHAQLCSELEHLAGSHPFRERLWGQWMLALYRSGRQAEALRVYQRLRRTLADELGLEPSAPLRALEAAVIVQDPGLDYRARLATAPAATPDVPRARHNLPLEATPLVGRDDLVDAVTAALERHRLVTLTGPGGIGKSRLATAAAARMVEAGRNEVWLVELAAVNEPIAVSSAVAAILGVTGAPGAPLVVAVAEHLVDRPALIVLDNCEHVIDAAAELVRAVLRTSRTATVLTTSREALDVDGELVVAVPGLSSGDPTSAAVRLFVQRGHLARHDFDPSRDDLVIIDEICTRLDGMPLAIELAAARVRSMTVEEIRSRLDHSLTLLGSGRRASSRRSTVDAALAWSYEQLEAAEQHAFEALSVFAGGATLDAVEGVLGQEGDAMSLVDGLVRKSMLEANARRGAMRYRLLEPLRHFARARLDERRPETGNDVRTRHADHYVTLAADARRQQSTPDGAVAVATFTVEWDNIAVALDWLVRTTEIDKALALTRSSFWFAITTFRFELLTFAERVVTLPGAENHDLWPAVAGITSVLRRGVGNLSGAQAMAEAALARADLQGQDCFEALYANVLAYGRYDPERAAAVVRRMDVIFGRGPDPIERGETQYLRTVPLVVAEHPDATAVAREAVRDAEASGSPHHLALAYTALAAATAISDWEGSLEIFARAHHHAAEANYRMIVKNQHVWMAYRAARRGGRQALAFARVALQGSLDDGYWGNFDVGLEAAILGLIDRGDPRTVAILAGGLRRLATDHSSTMRTVTAACDRLTNRTGNQLAELLELGASRSNRELGRLALDEITRLTSTSPS